MCVCVYMCMCRGADLMLPAHLMMAWYWLKQAPRPVVCIGAAQEDTACVCVFVVLCPLPGSGHVLLHSRSPALVPTTTWWNEFVLTLVLVLCLCAGFISVPIFRSYITLKGCIPEQSDTDGRGGGKPSIRGGSQSGRVLAILATAREGCLHRCLDLRISFHEYMMYLCCCVCMYVLPTCECVPGRQWCCHIQLCS